ncbi:hypothetical protein BaRGS_00020507 [Batillaria attramentaria]|uniref:Uncharacterized protein n=1 Tax=Batillaria attramentaria TaxID=370345 RepID=A0ABD0KMU4_9CAEN
MGSTTTTTVLSGGTCGTGTDTGPSGTSVTSTHWNTYGRYFPYYFWQSGQGDYDSTEEPRVVTKRSAHQPKRERASV